MSQIPGMYSVSEAAKELDISDDGIKYHLYKSKLLTGLIIGRDRFFTQEELDRFKATAPKPRGTSQRIRKTKEG